MKGCSKLKNVVKDRKKELDKTERMFRIIYDAVAHFKNKLASNMLKLDKILTRLENDKEREMLPCKANVMSLMSSYDDSNYLG